MPVNLSGKKDKRFSCYKNINHLLIPLSSIKKKKKTNTTMLRKHAYCLEKVMITQLDRLYLRITPFEVHWITFWKTEIVFSLKQ